MVRKLALLLTVLTGFSGLVYQVAWQKYLAILLGSHSEATCAVLGIFLGGLSAGYALFGVVSRRLAQRARGSGAAPPLLLAYGAVESAIGVYALLFPWLFGGVRSLSLWLPHGSPAAGFAVDVVLTALLIGPPTLLMGGTIPLLTQGLARRVDEATRFHAWVYACNTAGAFAGALAGGFLLVPRLGLAGSVLTMGCLNLAAGLAFAALHRFAALPEEAAADAAGAPEDGPSAPAVLPASPTPPAGFRAYAAAALLAGFAMMTLQTAMNRIGALALGASHFTFAMVVATFVLCIALGSFAVSALPRIGRAVLPLSQWALVLYLTALYPLVQDAPYWARALRRGFEAPDDFLAFYGAIFLWVLGGALIPIGLSGALLPLLFHHLRREVGDLGNVAGRLYSWNTLGSLLGALLGGYLLLFWLDLHATYRIAVLALAAAAAVLTARALSRGGLAAGAGLALVAAILGLAPPWQPGRLSSGLYRAHRLPEGFDRGPDAYFERYPGGAPEVRVAFHRDDPVASVAVWEWGTPEEPSSRSIVSNGKSDGNIPADNRTTGLLALLPALFAERSERAFVIGYGTGQTAGELVALDSMREVVVAEISRAVIEAAPLFEAFNGAPLRSPKLRLVRGDAYRVLSRSDDRFDVIVSEPSNPWVTGVEMLYSRDFLDAARERLTSGGVYAQWFHSYETDAESIALVLRTFRAVFDQVSVWRGAGPDLILLGFRNADADADAAADLAHLERRWARADFRRQLAALGLGSLPRLLAHEVLPRGVVGELPLPGALHTLLHPRLSHLAARAFYRRQNGRLPAGVEREAAAAGARRSLLRAHRERYGGVLPDEERLELLRETCFELERERCATLFAQWQYQQPDSPRLATSLAKARTLASLAPVLDPRVLTALASLFRPIAEDDPEASYERARDVSAVFARYYHHGAPFRAEPLHAAWRACAGRDPRCAEGYARARELGIELPLLSRR